MKKQFILLVAILFFSSFNIIYRMVPAAKATNVEGVITQDTIWTLVDSPFILTGNVTVNPGVTLTIEPGVQVRFGGDFSLIVNGRILAHGTEERMIYFTTNDPSNNTAWRTIAFKGIQSSSLTYCVVEYGKNGTTLEDGSLEVKNSLIRFNLENGITVIKGSLGIINSEIAFNGVNAINIDGGYLVSVETSIINANGNGIRIAAGGQVNVRNNFVSSNGNGIFLTGNLTGTVDIRQNEISSNKDNGIFLESKALSNTVITENNVSANRYGFLVSANASTYITHNYISNNTVGIYYSGGAQHQADFNDIYANDWGINVDALSSVTVNATHNYWGDRTGPKHLSLNPYGKGNQVGGNAVNLIVTPFLRHSFTYINNPPTAVLWTDKILVAPYQTITFVGTDSQDDGNVEEYLFDFNDATSSGWTTLSLYNHSYPSIGTYTASLTVEDDFGGKSASAYSTVNVENLTPLQTQITLSNSTVAYNHATYVTIYVASGTGAVANANVRLFSVRGGVFDSQSGSTDANGYFGTWFTAPNITQTTNVRIIARASLNGYADGSDYQYLEVLPPLRVDVSPVSSTIKSEENTTVNIRVTNELEEPVAGANLTISTDNGTLSASHAVTDLNGTATFNLTAPQTLTQINVTVTVSASKSEYADGQGDTTITVEPKRLVLEISANPDTIFSEGATAITANVTFDSVPIIDATVNVSSDIGGNFSQTTQLTDSKGLSRFAFIAPQTVESNGITATITAIVSKSGYLDDESQTIVSIKPKVLSVEIIPHAKNTYSSGMLNFTVHVGYGTTSIQGANVTMATLNGSFSQSTGMTDNYGNVTLTFIAPQINQPSNVTLSATATKDGYVNNTCDIEIPVDLRTFSVQISPATVRAGQTEIATVHLTCREDGTPVDGATVTLSYAYGEPLTNTTDFTGACQFAINVPEVQGNQLNITLTATRDGYAKKQANVMVNVAPSEAGFPLLALLLILIPVVIVVLLFLLVKFKVLVVSAKEETQS